MPPFLLWSATFGGLALAALLAWLRGSWTDRLVVWSLIADELLSGLLINHLGWGRVQSGPFLIDCALVVVLAVICVRTPRPFILVITILQLMIVGVHLARFVPAPAHQGGYASALFVLTIGQVLTAVIGTARLRRISTTDAANDAHLK